MKSAKAYADLALGQAIGTARKSVLMKIGPATLQQFPAFSA